MILLVFGSAGWNFLSSFPKLHSQYLVKTSDFKKKKKKTSDFSSLERGITLPSNLNAVSLLSFTVSFTVFNISFDSKKKLLSFMKSFQSVQLDFPKTNE